jgi:hypothetical protein
MRVGIGNMSAPGANSNEQKFGIGAIQRRLQGLRQGGGMRDMMSRGKNVYGAGGSYAAHSGGGGQYGRPVGSRDMDPMKSAINRRISQQNRMPNTRGRVGW